MWPTTILDSEISLLCYLESSILWHLLKKVQHSQNVFVMRRVCRVMYLHKIINLQYLFFGFWIGRCCLKNTTTCLRNGYSGSVILWFCNQLSKIYLTVFFLCLVTDPRGVWITCTCMPYYDFRKPLVSGYYKLLAVCMKIANKLNYFQVGKIAVNQAFNAYIRYSRDSQATSTQKFIACVTSICWNEVKDFLISERIRLQPCAS